MKKNLVANIREADKIHRPERESSRPQSTFLDCAGSVDVPPEKKGASWKAIKAATWRHRGTARK
jgi:hypothetical protein